MKVVFETRKAQKLFNSDKEILRKFGQSVAKRIKQRLFELESADTLQMVSHLPPPRCHELEGSDEHVFSVDVSENMRMLFHPVVGEFALKADGGLDLSSVEKVCIREVCDTHEGKVRR